MKSSFKDSLICLLSKVSLKVLPMIVGAVLWTLVCLVTALLPCSLVTKEIILFVIMGVIIFPLMVYYMWLSIEFASVDFFQRQPSKIFSILAFILLLFLYISGGIYCVNISKDIYETNINGYVYVDSQGCTHSTRHCKALNDNAIVVFTLEDYIKDMPVNPIICNECITDEDFARLSITRNKQK